ncbi:MAG: hypothetical protein WCW53_02670 [Syntrophales bacterium]
MSAESARRRFTEYDREKMVQRMILDRIRLKLQDIKEYYTELEDKFARDIIKLSERYEEEISEKNLTQEMKEEVAAYFGEEQSRFEELFLKNFRYSIIVTIYSFLETTLNDLCHHLYHSKKSLLTLDEVKGTGIERARLYLQKVCLIDFPEKSHDWQKIQKFNLVRNCIVHAEGNVEEVKSPEKLKKIIKNTRGISLYPSIQRFLRIENDYIPSIIFCIEKFIDKIHGEAFKKLSPVKPIVQ